jgi:hypothetical protein
MKATVTLREAAEMFGVGTTRAARYIMVEEEGATFGQFVRGYNSRGEALLDGASVAERVAKRLGRGNWRGRNLKRFAEPSRRNSSGARLCYGLNCRSVVTGRDRLCERHKKSKHSPDERRRT